MVNSAENQAFEHSQKILKSVLERGPLKSTNRETRREGKLQNQAIYEPAGVALKGMPKKVATTNAAFDSRVSIPAEDSPSPIYANQHEMQSDPSYLQSRHEEEVTYLEIIADDEMQDDTYANTETILSHLKPGSKAEMGTVKGENFQADYDKMHLIEEDASAKPVYVNQTEIGKDYLQHTDGPKEEELYLTIVQDNQEEYIIYANT